MGSKERGCEEFKPIFNVKFNGEDIEIYLQDTDFKFKKTLCSEL